LLAKFLVKNTKHLQQNNLKIIIIIIIIFKFWVLGHGGHNAKKFATQNNFFKKTLEPMTSIVMVRASHYKFTSCWEGNANPRRE
jgi:hypothetical protein